MKPIRTAIIGTGFMGRAHLEAVRRTESVEAVAIAGRSVEAAQRIGAGFSIPTISTNYNDILRDPAIDAVHICTPNALHFPMAKAALQAGKHVILRKTVGHDGRRGPGAGRPRPASRNAQLRLSQFALLPHGAANAKSVCSRGVG